MKIFLFLDRWKQMGIVLIRWDPVAWSVWTSIISVVLWSCWDLSSPVGITPGVGRRKISPFHCLEFGDGRRGWSSTTPASSLPLLSRAACRQEHPQPRKYSAGGDQINHLQNSVVHGLFKSQISQRQDSHSPQLSASSRRKSKWSPLSLQACFLQLFELSVPQVITSHMCHFSFTMLNRALIKRFAVPSWIFFWKKKKHTIARSSCHSTERYASNRRADLNNNIQKTWKMWNYSKWLANGTCFLWEIWLEGWGWGSVPLDTS